MIKSTKFIDKVSTEYHISSGNLNSQGSDQDHFVLLFLQMTIFIPKSQTDGLRSAK